MGKRIWRSFVASAGVAGAAVLSSRARQRRQFLAQSISQVTETAIASLDVPAESAYLPGNGVQLHTVLAGPEDGPLALLLHGFPECWYSWRHQIPILAQAGYRVVAPDQRGYNLSDKPHRVSEYATDLITADALALIQALGRERATIVAHDWGGAVAWRLAMDYPGAIDKLVVMNAPHPVTFAKALRSDRSQQLKSWYMFFFQVPWLPETLLTLSPLATARLFFRRTAVHPNAFSDADLKVMAAALAQPSAMEAMIHWYRASFRHRPAKRASVIETPTLLIWAEDDVALGKPLTYGLEQRVSNLEVHYVPHCGHWVQNEAPEEVNECMSSFLCRGE